LRARIVRPPRAVGEPSSNTKPVQQQDDTSLPFMPPALDDAAQAIGIGATVAFGGLVFAVSFATLVFSGPDAPEGAIAAGTGFIMFSGLAGACVVAARSTLPAIAEVQDGPSAIFAIMAAAIYATEGIDESEKLPTVEAAIALTSVGTGVVMSALGAAKLGNIVRLLPSPVSGGFLAGTGWVLTAGAFKVLTGTAFEPANVLDAAHSPQLFTVVLPGAALGAAIAVGNRLIGKFWVVPSFLLGGCLAYFGALEFALGMSPDDALRAGLLLGPFDLAGAGYVPFVFDADALAKVRWDVVGDQFPRMLTTFGLSTLGLLLITSAVEVSTSREGDANKELKAVGVANVLGGLGGGLISYHSLSATQIAHSMGSRSRLPGLVCAAAYGAALVVGPAPLAYVPTFLVGGLLLFIGLSFLYEWIVEGYDNLPRSEYTVVVLIVVTVASQGYLAGVVAGILGAAVVFVSDYSRVPIVRARLQVGGRGGIRSSAARTRAEVEVIVRLGGGVYGAKLQGYLFFATAYRLLEEIRARHERCKADGAPLTYVVLDFLNVVGVDGSAISVFEKLRRFCAREKITLVLSDVDRAELRRVVAITLFGEDRPTFAFVDRVDASEQSKQIFRVPRLENLYDEVDGQYAGEVLATCETGGVVQARDLDAALRFVENSMIARKEELSDWGRRSLGSPGASTDDPETNPDEKDASGRFGVRASSFDDALFDTDADEGSGTSWTSFQGMVNAVCGGDPSLETTFRDAWRPVKFRAGDVVCERGEIADRIFWVEDATLRVDMARGKMSELVNTVDESLDDIDRVGFGGSGDDDDDDAGAGGGETFGERVFSAGRGSSKVLYRFGDTGGNGDDGVVIETLDDPSTPATGSPGGKDRDGGGKDRRMGPNRVKDVAVKTGAAAGAGGLLASAAATAVNMSTAAKAATAAAAAASAAGAAMTGVDPGTVVAAAGAAAEATQLAGSVAQTAAAAAPTVASSAANVAAAASTAINAAAAAAGGAGIGGAIGGLSSAVLRSSDKDDDDDGGGGGAGSGSVDEGSSGSVDLEDDALNAAGEEAPTSRGFGMSVTRDFIGAVGFYRRGGVGQVRFGRIVVEKGGTGYVLDEETMERLERESPALAMRLHKVMAGTLANQVVSRNKLITQYVR